METQQLRLPFTFSQTDNRFSLFHYNVNYLQKCALKSLVNVEGTGAEPHRLEDLSNFINEAGKASEHKLAAAPETEESVFEAAKRQCLESLSSEWAWLSNIVQGHLDLTEAAQGIQTSVEMIRTGTSEARNHLLELEIQLNDYQGARQAQLQSLAEMERKLQPFILIDHPLFVKLNQAPPETLVEVMGKGKFLELKSLLASIDDACLEIKSIHHPQAGSYLARYEAFRDQLCVQWKSLLTRTLDRAGSQLEVHLKKSQSLLQKSLAQKARMRSIVKASLDKNSPVDSDQEDPSQGALETQSFGDSGTFLPARWVYIKFRVYGNHIRPVVAFLADRALRVSAQIYKDTIRQIHAIYASFRTLFVLDSFQRQVYHIIRKHVEDDGTQNLDVAMRQAASFWLSVSDYEMDMQKAYFGDEGAVCGTSIESILENLGEAFYDAIRVKVIEISQLETLRSIYECMSFDIADVQQVSLGDSLRQRTLRSIVLSPIVRIRRDLQEKLIHKSTEYIATQLAEIEVMDNATTSDYPAILQKLNSKSDRQKHHALCTARAVHCLRRIGTTLDSEILRTLAQDIVQNTTEQLNNIMAFIDRRDEESWIDAYLFGIRELMFLRSHLSTYRYDASGTSEATGTQRTLSFSRLKRSVGDVFSFMSAQPRQEGSRSLAVRNGQRVAQIGGFFSLVTPDLEDTQLDAQEVINLRLEETIEGVISTTTSKVLFPLIVWVSKVSAGELTVPDLQGETLKTIGHFWTILSKTLARVLTSVALYLHHEANLGTDFNLTDLESFVETHKTQMHGTSSRRSDAQSLSGQSLLFGANSASSLHGSHLTAPESIRLLQEPIRVAIVEGYRLGELTSISL